MNAPTPLNLPLSGVRVVEASAGTGKTFTIATLYLRLILERGLSPEQIVVATFTRAATAELAMRLRKRLRLAARLLRQDEPAREREDDDGETRETRRLMGRLLHGESMDAASLAERARCAERAMDTAVIGTLHGFCNRVLSEFGFETGGLVQRELLEDSRALQQEIVEDFWRSCSTDADAARVLSETWRKPDVLAKQVIDPRWRGRTVTNAEELEAAAGDARARRPETLMRLDAIRNAIAGWDEAALREADTQLAECFDGRGGSARDARIRGLREIHAWARGSTAADPLSAKAAKAVEDLSERVMSTKASCKRMPQGAVFTAVADLDANLRSLEQLDQVACAKLLLDARAHLERELPRRMRALGAIGHDEAVDELASALDDDAHALRAIRARWPAALVDEFQDTDPQQWRVLEKLFAHEHGTLVLVGDPKQAIYGFRGGDVHAWLMARRRADGEPLRLSESQRGGTGVTDAINALFSRADAFVEPGIAHEDVRSAPRVAGRALLVDGNAEPGLRIWRLPDAGANAQGKAKSHPKGDMQRRIEASCVAQIVDWLEGARQGRVRLREGDGSARELRARDIAVLVDSNREARSMQRALGRAGVPAASCLRASVYASDEAGDLRLLLEALRDPADAPRARAARASALIGDDAAAIARTRDSGAALDALLSEMAEWSAEVERRGPLPLLHRLIARAAPRLLALPGGERRVTDYLQLAEILQREHATCFGLEDLCERHARALRESSSDTDADALRLRLDTDAEAVQIATVHAAKGLEYGVVLLPCAASGREPRKSAQPALVWHHDGDRACVSVGDDAPGEIIARAKTEAFAEDIRKFYVGVTRARAACVIPWGCARQGANTAMHWLAHAASRTEALPFDDAGCAQALRELIARGKGGVAESELPQGGDVRLPKLRIEDGRVAAARFQREIERDWRAWSFSRLVRQDARGTQGDPAPGSGDDTAVAAADDAPAIDAPPVLAGARFGSAVHAALEETDFAAWRDADGVPASERALLARALREQGLPQPGTVSPEHALTEVGVCIVSALNVRLKCGARLCDVAPARRRAEMEFHLRLAPSRSADLYALLHAHGYQRGREGLGVARLNGLLTGVIDLVFEHDGRHHLVDWKTNLLPDYDAPSLRAAIAAHDYDLQYLIYALALHRWLRQALPRYDYDAHVGDVYYLFVRDLREGRGVHRDRPPRGLIEAMDALFDAREAAAA